MPRASMSVLGVQNQVSIALSGWFPWHAPWGWRGDGQDANRRCWQLSAPKVMPSASMLMVGKMLTGDADSKQDADGRCWCWVRCWWWWQPLEVVILVGFTGPERPQIQVTEVRVCLTKKQEGGIAGINVAGTWTTDDFNNDFGVMPHFVQGSGELCCIWFTLFQQIDDCSSSITSF